MVRAGFTAVYIKTIAPRLCSLFLLPIPYNSLVRHVLPGVITAVAIGLSCTHARTHGLLGAHSWFVVLTVESLVYPIDVNRVWEIWRYAVNTP